MQPIVDTNIIGTSNKIELLECRRFNERPNSLYYYYTADQDDLLYHFLQLWVTNCISWFSFEVALHIVFNLFYYIVE